MSIAERLYEPWTDAERERLARLHGRGLPYKQIARLLRRSVGGVAGMAGRLRLRRLGTTRHWRGVILRLHAEGFSDRQIADRLDLSAGRVWQVRSGLGLSRAGRGRG